MTNKRKRPRLQRATAEALGHVDAAARGCTCNPETKVVHDRGVTHVTIAHDDWCPVVQGQP